MKDYTYLLVCQDANGGNHVAECESWQAEIGALAEVEGELLEIVAVNHVAVGGEDYLFVAPLHEIKPVTAIYRKVYKMTQEDQDGTDAD